MHGVYVVTQKSAHPRKNTCIELKFTQISSHPGASFAYLRYIVSYFTEGYHK